mmetsp:Transcript_62892/g.150457  ORF Transcript_62892/g.150457 Transcript_62892/m.150457 type:complete len:406 (+) Transcript_62892:7997-9214(+)
MGYRDFEGALTVLLVSQSNVGKVDVHSSQLSSEFFTREEHGLGEARVFEGFQTSIDSSVRKPGPVDVAFTDHDDFVEGLDVDVHSLPGAAWRRDSEEYSRHAVDIQLCVQTQVLQTLLSEVNGRERAEDCEGGDIVGCTWKVEREGAFSDGVCLAGGIAAQWDSVADLSPVGQGVWPELVGQARMLKRGAEVLARHVYALFCSAIGSSVIGFGRALGDSVLGHQDFDVPIHQFTGTVRLEISGAAAGVVEVPLEVCLQLGNQLAFGGREEHGTVGGKRVHDDQAVSVAVHAWGLREVDHVHAPEIIDCHNNLWEVGVVAVGNASARFHAGVAFPRHVAELQSFGGEPNCSGEDALKHLFRTVVEDQVHVVCGRELPEHAREDRWDLRGRIESGSRLEVGCRQKGE